MASSSNAVSSSSNKRFFPGARDRVKQWRRLNRRWRANSQTIIKAWHDRDPILRRGLLRKLWLRNKAPDGEENAEGNVVEKLPRDRRVDLEGIAPWRAKDGKEPTAKSMLRPKGRLPDHIDKWVPTWSPDRTKMMFPFINEQTLETDGLLEFIRARAADPPSAFSAWDGNSVNMKLKRACGYIERGDDRKLIIPNWVDLDDLDPNNYGLELNLQREVAEYLGLDSEKIDPDSSLLDEEKAAFQGAHIQDRLIPKRQAPLVMEVQEALYDFLLDVCEELAGKDASKDEEESSQDGDGDGDEAMPGADDAWDMGDAVRDLATPWRIKKPDPDARGSQIRQYLGSCREGIPFTSPIDINWDFLELSVWERLRSVEGDLLRMREDPGYFAQKMQENREHHWRQVDPITEPYPGIPPRGRSKQLGWCEDSYKTFELRAAIVQRVITYEIWCACFQYVTELRGKWDDHLEEERLTGEFPQDAIRNIQLLMVLALHMTLLGTEIPARSHLRCDKPMRKHYERNDGMTTIQEFTYRDDANASLDEQKLACMLWHVLDEDLRQGIELNNITEDMAEIVEKDSNGFSDLNKGYMADFRAARDVGMEVNKFLMRYTDNRFLGTWDKDKNKRPATWDAYAEWTMPLKILKEDVNYSIPYYDPRLKGETPPSDWFPLVEKAEKAEASNYSRQDNPTIQISKDNRQAEDNLKTFWDAFDAMLEEKGAFPAETKALFGRARPLRTPVVTTAPAKTSGRKQPTKSTGGVSKKTKKNKHLGAHNIAAAAAAGPSGTQPSSSSSSNQEATVVDFSAGPGFVDRPSRPTLEERREKAKTRGVPRPFQEPVRAPEGQAPAPEMQIPVTKRAMDTLTLLLGPFTENQPVPWADVLHMMTTIGFSVRTTRTGGSQRIFKPTEKLKNIYGVNQAVSKHEPHPDNWHPLHNMREWARNTGYGLAKLGWTLDTFKLETKGEEED
ncbi:hypothetical protein PG996_013343 [Apiospora saccharicola]|uniref:Uncharacterized protein n=1 Tax=Apiospora saccharicola TaxID=335842 RepID=A0ABR1U578_9PEZI